MVVARESDTMVAVLPSGSVESKSAWYEATSYLVVKDSGGGLKVLWTRIVHVLMYSDLDASPKSFEVVMAELEKRMKARSRKTKK